MPEPVATPTAPPNTTSAVSALLSAVYDLDLGRITSGREAFETTKVMITAVSALCYQLAVCAAHMDRLGVAKQRDNGKTKALLITMGLAPSVAERTLRIGLGMPRMQLLAGYAEDGVLPAEHLDAIVSGVAHVARRALDGLCDEERREVEVELIAQAMSGATPKQISTKARELGNTFAAETGGLPAAEDRSINEFSVTETSDGRIAVRGDLDIVTGTRLQTAIESLVDPRPQPDGSKDARTPGQQRADALNLVLEAAANNPTPFVAAPHTDLNVTVSANTPAPATLQWTSALTQATAELLACDSKVTEIVLDGEGVPLKMGEKKRRFPHHLRKAILIRDTCCVKCGAPSWMGECHHIAYWSHGGPTDLDNGCLLCASCHAQIHASDWEIVMGVDRHPWLIPPTTIDPARKPLPAYNRRTMTLDDRVAA
ncbi:DUF222 domain-containing protein [Gordonia sp. CPCC 205515]|uniref:HNH endonuclease n=1 Tax=Gordonia sp. CPCC 205515 TaxID=3140791 RepID=UPI003AF36C67